MKSDSDLKQIIEKKVLITRSEETKKTRSLSSHVGSRWYRAPEVSLMEKKYDTAADIWSIGCCFYELIKHFSLPKKSS